MEIVKIYCIYYKAASDRPDHIFLNKTDAAKELELLNMGHAYKPWFLKHQHALDYDGEYFLLDKILIDEPTY
jgi:hypothetical protein